MTNGQDLLDDAENWETLFEQNFPWAILKIEGSYTAGLAEICQHFSCKILNRNAAMLTIVTSLRCEGEHKRQVIPLFMVALLHSIRYQGDYRMSLDIHRSTEEEVSSLGLGKLSLDDLAFATLIEAGFPLQNPCLSEADLQLILDHIRRQHGTSQSLSSFDKVD